VIRRRLIIAALLLAKVVGLFALARKLTGGQLRILCYHGFALDDEDRFRESLFISRRRFAQRMRFLRQGHFPVLALDEAMRRLRRGTLPPAAVAITIDDGFYSTHAIAKDILRDNGFPSTLYLTSYYFQKGTPIFQLAVDYICWKSPLGTVDLSDLGVPLLQRENAMPLNAANRRWASAAIHRHGTETLDEPGRVELSRRLARRLSVDYDELLRSRALSLVNPQELRELQASGMRIGLHTHRHRFPTIPADAIRELEENRASVEPAIGRRMADFCYPSGDWSPRHFAALERAGVETATTCEAGLVRGAHDPYALPRVLDDTRVSMIEFEAEVSGFSEILRWLRIKSGYNALKISLYGETVPNSFAHVLSI
jgi:peptidoglycan/xylan/chitin deacetylase (PgdA/CDA1 family)